MVDLFLVVGHVGTALAVILLRWLPWSRSPFMKPRLQPIAMALVSVVFLQSIGSIPGAGASTTASLPPNCNRGEIIATVVSIVTAVAVATHGGGALGLVIKQCAFFGVRVALTFWCSRTGPSSSSICTVLPSICDSGRDVLGMNIIGFFTRSIDKLVIGKVLGAAALGIYSMGFQFALLPNTLVSGPLQFVIYARLAKVKDDKVVIRRTFLVLTRVLTTLIFPPMCLIAAAYHPVFTLLLTAKWAVAGKMFMLVAPACAFQSVNALCATIMLVLGRTETRLRTVVEFGCLSLLMLSLCVWFGIEAVAIGFDCIVAIYTPRLLVLTLPLIECSVGDYVRAIATPVVATFACIAVFLGIRTLAEVGRLAATGAGGFLRGGRCWR